MIGTITNVDDNVLTVSVGESAPSEIKKLTESALVEVVPSDEITRLTVERDEARRDLDTCRTTADVLRDTIDEERGRATMAKENLRRASAAVDSVRVALTEAGVVEPPDVMLSLAGAVERVAARATAAEARVVEVEGERNHAVEEHAVACKDLRESQRDHSLTKRALGMSEKDLDTARARIASLEAALGEWQQQLHGLVQDHAPDSARVIEEHDLDEFRSALYGLALLTPTAPAREIAVAFAFSCGFCGLDTPDLANHACLPTPGDLVGRGEEVGNG